MTKWTYIIKTLLKSEMQQKTVRDAIISNCLLSPKKICGAYQVDDTKVWEYIISKDNGCKKKMKELRISNLFGVYSYYAEISYKQMRSTYPRKRRKKGV